MRASRFSDAQKAFILKQGADGVPVEEICRRAGISQVTWATKAPSFNMRVRHKEADYEEVKVYGRAESWSRET